MLKAVARQVGGGGSGTIDLNAGTIAGNPGAGTGPAESVIVGGGLELLDLATSSLNAQQTTLYLRYGLPDTTGLTGPSQIPAYRTASVTASSTAETTIPTPLTGTSFVSIVDFITPPGTPGAIALPIANAIRKIWASVDAGVAKLGLLVFKCTLDGVETQLSSSTSDNFSDTAAALQYFKTISTGVNALLPTDRLLFRLRAARVSGPDPINLTTYFDGTLPGSAGVHASSVTIPIPVGLRSDVNFDYNVIDQGGVANAKTYTDGIIAAGSNSLTSASATFGLQDEGKIIELNGAGVGGLTGAPFIGTIATYVSAHNVLLSGTADTATAGLQFFSSASVVTGGSLGSYYQPGETLNLVGGTHTITAVVNVASTEVHPPTDTDPAFTIVNAGSLGIEGTYIFETTTQNGTAAHIRGVVSAAGSLTSVEYVSGGAFITNPGTSAEPIANTESGLTGATVSIAGIDVRSVSFNTAGSYSVIPTDPVATTAGSISGATGCELDVSWVGAGQFVYATSARDAIEKAIVAAGAIFTAEGRKTVRIPAGNYFLTGAELPIMTTPVRIDGDGINQTNIIVGAGYLGRHVFGWSNITQSNVFTPPTGTTGSMTQALNGSGATNLTIAGNRLSATRQSGIVIYDRADGMIFDSIEIRYLNGSAFWTGPFNVNKSSYLRESIISRIYMRNCGDNGYPVMNLDSVGTTAGLNFMDLDTINIVFPIGPGLAITNHCTKRDGVKTIYINNLRIERRQDQTAYGNLFEIGSTTDLNAVKSVYVTQFHGVAVGAGASAIALYGMTENTRPHDIQIDDIAVTGPILGTGITVYAGYAIELGCQQLEARTSDITIGNHSDYRLVTTAGSGSTSSTVVTAAGPATDNENVGAAAVHTVQCDFVGSQTLTTLTVTSISVGRLLVGAVMTSANRGTQKILSQLTGSAGSTGTYQMSISQTVSAGTSMTVVYSETRNVVSYVASTKTSTIGATQGSVATWTNTPASGDDIAFQSLVDGYILINGYGNEADFDYTFGTGAAALITTPVVASGDPTGPGQITREIDDITITGGNIGGVPVSTWPVSALEFQIDGGGIAITTGIKGYVLIPFACTVTQWTVLLSDAAGAAVANTIAIDVLGDTYANYVSSTSKVGGGTKPGTSAATKGQAAPASWTSTAFAAGDIVGFNVTTAPAAASRCTIALTLQRT